ncbi:ArsR/SmtB family transcription factor [Psychromicrobium lacuslunae]|uniref:ArsR family transcriptional regulator n=1 Tax=Psychromicrobium lacuslunae TaxID=1618207 RepID=A0A0D4BXN9_9MICC|nr:metalloregulator ArsR/SmtB family transcription factor [Psychromicrobium lacuslunae]AJT41078.1 ArsR family transcriptional regulator [Psychromicrobium lacuslunae]
MPATDSLSMVFAALADPTRREILSRLAQGSATVSEVAEPFKMSAPAISQHLKVLERAGLVKRTAHAQWRTISMLTEPLDQASVWVEKHRRDWNHRLDLLETHLESMKKASQNKEVGT